MSAVFRARIQPRPRPRVAFGATAAAGGTLSQITLDADGTLDAVIRHDAGTGAPFYTHCNDAPDGVSTDYVENDDSESSGVAWFSLTDVDADFGSMDTLDIDVDVEATGFGDDTCSLTARIFDADNDTSMPLTDETTALATEADSTRTQRNVSFSGLTGTKAQWNAAYIRFTWTYAKVTGPDNANIRLYGCDIDGTYTVVSPAATVIHRRSAPESAFRPHEIHAAHRVRLPFAPTRTPTPAAALRQKVVPLSAYREQRRRLQPRARPSLGKAAAGVVLPPRQAAPRQAFDGRAWKTVARLIGVFGFQRLLPVPAAPRPAPVQAFGEPARWSRRALRAVFTAASVGGLAVPRRPSPPSRLFFGGFGLRRRAAAVFGFTRALPSWVRPRPAPARAFAPPDRQILRASRAVLTAVRGLVLPKRRSPPNRVFFGENRQRPRLAAVFGFARSLPVFVQPRTAPRDNFKPSARRLEKRNRFFLSVATPSIVGFSSFVRRTAPNWLFPRGYDGRYLRQRLDAAFGVQRFLPVPTQRRGPPAVHSGFPRFAELRHRLAVVFGKAPAGPVFARQAGLRHRVPEDNAARRVDWRARFAGAFGKRRTAFVVRPRQMPVAARFERRVWSTRRVAPAGRQVGGVFISRRGLVAYQDLFARTCRLRTDPRRGIGAFGRDSGAATQQTVLPLRHRWPDEPFTRRRNWFKRRLKLFVQITGLTGLRIRVTETRPDATQVSARWDTTQTATRWDVTQTHKRTST